MCLAVPGKVKKIEGKKLLIQYPGEERQVLNAGIEVKEGDYVMVQMGVVVKKLTPKEAKESIKAWSSVEK